uniref:CDK2 associated cullin domain 1 n=1 Tax=Eptatretus burgeri TaxID=7764 RepID=A0A8C4WU83_EPTBU
MDETLEALEDLNHNNRAAGPGQTKQPGHGSLSVSDKAQSPEQADGRGRKNSAADAVKSATKFLMNVITVEDYRTIYWPKLDKALEKLLVQSPRDYIPISYEQIYSCVYKCVCQQHSERMHSDLIAKISLHLNNLSEELQGCSEETYVENFGAAMVRYMGALHSIVPLFIYMNKVYMENKLNRDLKEELVALYSNLVAAKHINRLLPRLLEAQAVPFAIPPSTMASIVKGLYSLRPEWAHCAPHLFAKFIPNLLPPVLEDHVQQYALLDQHLQQDLLINGFGRLLCRREFQLRDLIHKAFYDLYFPNATHPAQVRLHFFKVICIHLYGSS